MTTTNTRGGMRLGALTAAALAAAVAGCASLGPDSSRTATIQRTANGVAHVSAPDWETLAYGMAYAYAQDNVCMTAQHLVTVRGERSRHFGGTATSALGLQQLPNEQIDLFVAAHMDDAALARAAAATSPRVQALVRGYVAGYNRYLADHTGRLPEACNGQPWVQPMTVAEYHRIGELSAVQAGLGALAGAMLAAQPPAAAAAAAAPPRIDTAAAAQLMREAGVLHPEEAGFGSNAWAFGKGTTEGGRGMLLGNPHFPWTGVNRFWQVHLTVPGELDVMGAAIGTSAAVVIGFNKDVAWSHTVSTGRRFTLHELALVPGDPTSYLVDGAPEKMRSRSVTRMIKGSDGTFTVKQHTVWSTRWGPLVVLPRAGLTWTAQRAYALQDANSGNMRGTDTWLGIGTARNVADIQRALRNLGTPWVNTIAADRDGNALYADASVVPDVDAAMLERCAPSKEAAALRGGAGLVVLDGSKAACQWRRDPASAVPGLTPIERLPQVVRNDWVHNSNDSFFYTHPEARFAGISPLVGDDVMRQQRTRSGLIEVPELVAGGPVTLPRIQAQLFANRNLMGRVLLPDLLAACAAGAPNDDARAGCTALRGWDRNNNAESRGAHLFREFWRGVMNTPRLYRVPVDKAQPTATPVGLNMADAEVAGKVWAALEGAVKKVRASNVALDAPLGSVQRPAITSEAIALHGGQGFEGVLNYLGDGSAGWGAQGYRVDYGTSYVQTVGFDGRGPVAHALLTYGQSTDPASPFVADQLRLYSAKQWPRLPFHADDVERERRGELLRISRP
jgi:acyl-homoserine-lactone acylase